MWLLTLARAHAKAGDPWKISGYLAPASGSTKAMGKFALAYADQAERDHAALKAAVRAGVVGLCTWSGDKSLMLRQPGGQGQCDVIRESGLLRMAHLTASS